MAQVFIVSRPGNAGRLLSEQIRERGAAVFWLPAFEIAPAPDQQVIALQLGRLAVFRLVVFVSPNAVQAVSDRLNGKWPDGVLLAAVGAATLACARAAWPELPAHRFIAPGSAAVCAIESPADLSRINRIHASAHVSADADLESSESSGASEALWSLLSAKNWHGNSVLIIRAGEGRQWLIERFKAAGANVTALAVYARQAAQIDAHSAECLRAHELAKDTPCVIVSSSAAIEVMARWWTSLGISAWIASGRAVAQHPRIYEQLVVAGQKNLQLAGWTFEEVWAAAMRP